VTPLQDGSVPEPEPALPAGEQPAASVQPELSLVEEESRRYPSTIGGAFYLAVLGLTGIALVVIGLGHWRGGVQTLGAGLVAAAAVRGLLPRRDVGMLQVRSRWFDVTLLAAAGVALWVLASTIPAGG